jgi:hypothetical protein
MNAAELASQVEIELEQMAGVVAEIKKFLDQLGEDEPSGFQKAGAGALMSQFYSGIERIFKRICIYSGVALPTGSRWHTELFKMFCEPGGDVLPVLLDAELEDSLRPYRGFRHAFVHGYAVLLEWREMRPGLISIGDVFAGFRENARRFLATLKNAE